jgi:acetyltransferase-like isoleucine patch superfamily enzyme
VVTRDLPAGTVAFGNPAMVRGRVADLTPVTDRVVETGTRLGSRFGLKLNGDGHPRRGEGR